MLNDIPTKESEITIITSKAANTYNFFDREGFVLAFEFSSANLKGKKNKKLKEMRLIHPFIPFK